LQINTFMVDTLAIMEKFATKTRELKGEKVAMGTKGAKIKYALENEKSIYDFGKYVRLVSPLLPKRIRKDALEAVKWIERYLPWLSRPAAFIGGYAAQIRKFRAAVASAALSISALALVVWEEEWTQPLRDAYNDLFDDEDDVIFEEENKEEKEKGLTFEEAMHRVINKTVDGDLKKKLLNTLPPSQKSQKIKSPAAIKAFLVHAETEIFKWQAKSIQKTLQKEFLRHDKSFKLPSYDVNALPCQNIESLRKIFWDMGPKKGHPDENIGHIAFEQFSKRLRSKGFTIFDWCGLD